MISLAEIAIPSLGQCLRVLAPLAGLAAFVWLLRNVDDLIRRHLPSLEWGRQLGWFNIRAERRAARFLRGMEAAFQLLLAMALLGLLWGASGLHELPNWRDPEVMRRLQDHASILILCAILWTVYLSVELAPRLRREFEEEELERYRAERAALEQEEEPPESSRQTTPAARSTAPFRKQR